MTPLGSSRRPIRVSCSGSSYRSIWDVTAMSFIEEDFKGVDKNLDDPMVILVVAINFLIKKVLVD